MPANTPALDAVAERPLEHFSHEQLRALAASLLRKRSGERRARATSLLHEAYLRFAPGGKRARSHEHFLAVAARAMRFVLVDRARRRLAEKRSDARVTSLDVEPAAPNEHPSEAVTAVHDALTRLAQVDLRLAQMVELRYFGGLEIDETARALGVSTATVKRDWALARAWLRRELGEGAGAVTA